jgi:hypothetical protein
MESSPFSYAFSREERNFPRNTFESALTGRKKDFPELIHADESGESPPPGIRQ